MEGSRVVAAWRALRFVAGWRALRVLAAWRDLRVVGFGFRGGQVSRAVFECSRTSSVAGDGRMQELKFKDAVQSGDATRRPCFGTFSSCLAALNWPEIRAAERALDRQAWWNAIKILAPLKLKAP
eukprot:313580-Chlamydomonas_euryale.AAC.1